MVKSMNPMEAHRREQKKKELKKHRMERKKDREAKLGSMDPVKLQEKLKNLEHQVAVNPMDGPMRKRKQELEDTLQVVMKRQKEMAEEEHKKKLTDVPLSLSMSLVELTKVNKEKFQNPENSIYYHPILNPFGAPPPGRPQMYRNVPSGSLGPPTGPPRQGRSQQQRFRGQPPISRAEGRPSSAPMQHPRMMARRPGKRPPLPLVPPPPGTIQVPSRPPLPSGTIPARPPPPPPLSIQIAGETVPPPPLLQQPRETVPPSAPYLAIHDRKTESDQAEVVVSYPTMDEPDFHDVRMEEEQGVDDEAAKRAAASQTQLRSLVPVALRVQRQVPGCSIASVSSAPSVAASCRPRAPVPRPMMSSIDVIPCPPSRPATIAVSSSVSQEFDTFMVEVKELLERQM